MLDMKNILRYPRLDTVLMVESFIQEHDGEYVIANPVNNPDMIILGLHIAHW
ncbi:MAG: hypothetical protein V1870_04875 [Candidatus Aenigmatarchaeota archaeon]